METNMLHKVSSITKKLVVGLLGAFLLLFLLFHMCANLLILRADDGTAYSAFCHFMGTNIFVKIFEMILLAVLVLHICLTLILWGQNRRARGTERYHQPSKTKTATGSKMMALTGVLIFAFLVMHFFNFWLIKVDVVKGSYMVKTEAVQTEEVMGLQGASQQYQTTPEEFLAMYEQQVQASTGQMDSATTEMVYENLAKLKKAAPAAEFMTRVMDANQDDAVVSKDGKWIKKINKEDKETLEAALDCEVEPDFYYQARSLFKNPLYCIMYLLTFAILWIHLRHAFESVFQTWGLENYKYYPIIKFCAILYAWVVCLGFALIPVCVWLFI